MPSAHTSYYLTLPPLDAIVEIINQKYGMSLRVDNTTISNVTKVDEAIIQFFLDGNQSSSARDIAPHITPQVFQLERLNLGLYFGSYVDLSTIGSFAPTSTVDIGQWLSDQTNIFFGFDDFINEEIDPTDFVTNGYVLRAHPRSLRWHGYLQFLNELPIRYTTDGFERYDTNSLLRRIELVQ